MHQQELLLLVYILFGFPNEFGKFCSKIIIQHRHHYRYCNRRNDEYILENEGDMESIQFNELRSLKNAHPKFFTIPLIIVDDEKAVKKLGLEKLYSELAYLNDLKSFFENNYEDEIVQKLNNLSDFSRMQVFEKLKQMVKDKTFIDMDVRELIKKHYTIDILLLQ